MDSRKLKIKVAAAAAVFVAVCLAACGLRACSDARTAEEAAEQPAAEQAAASEDDGLGEGIEQPNDDEVAFTSEQQRILSEASEDEEAAMAVLCDGIWTATSSTLQFFGNNTYVETFKDEPGEPRAFAVHVLDLNQEGVGQAQKVSYVLQLATSDGDHVANLAKKSAPQGGEAYWQLDCEGAFVHGDTFQLTSNATSFTVSGCEALEPYVKDYERLASCVEELGGWIRAKYPTATMAVWDEQADFDLGKGELVIGFVLDNATTTSLEMEVDLDDWSWSVSKRAKSQGVL